jgi:DNA-binding MarR family transcriptional regulator/GNAT superfamily N-acetyltransferase
MDFFERTGKMALGSRLRRLSERITEDAVQIYQLYGNDLQPRWFPVFYTLAEQGAQSITDIAREIGQSHVAVSQTVRELVKKGYVVNEAGERDGRKTVVALSETGLALAHKLESQYRDVNDAIESTLAEADHDLWKSIGEWEHLLERKSLLRRVQEQKKRREAAGVQIVDYTPAYQQAFRDLNVEWISTYFKMEEADYKALDHPDDYILQQGGHIFMALLDGEPVGTCAMIKMNDATYELAKMAVSPRAQGKSIGWLLGQAIIEKARALGAKTVYLESNTKLVPAINLYYKLGFEKVTGRPTPYERCNIQMEVQL